jgi:diguanylate cyclase (GGDEF)-like protein
MVTVSQKTKVKSTPNKVAKIHLGLCQLGTDIEKNLVALKLDEIVVIHRFDTPDQLYEHNQRSYIDLVIIAADEDKSWITDMIRRIKSQSILEYIPIMVFAPGATRELVISILKEGGDDIAVDDWDHEVISARIEMLIMRSRRDLGVNPSSRLPGPSVIEHEIDRRIKAGRKFAVCYADLDNFKAYNDYYGYMYGDKMIKITSHIIRNIVHDLTPQGFVGHIGGDDFVFIIPPNMVKQVCTNVISTFDRMVPFRYEEADRERGWIEVPNRKGEMERYEIVTISIAVLKNQKRMFNHPGEMSHMMADLKKYTKTLPGSNYVIERRRKY